MKAIEFRNIRKQFGECVSCDNLSFSVEAGTIHGLVGENGAGKSTAMKTLFGLHAPDAGEIFIREKKSSVRNPVQAMQHGIGMVHQHFMLAPTETVLDNIVLGREPRRFGFFLNPQKVRQELDVISKAHGLRFHRWDARVETLSVGEQQRAEIIKLLYQKSDILILDEPTAVLTPQEVKELFLNLRKLKQEGKTIVLISHKLREVLAYTDFVTVMRRGTAIGSKPTRETNERGLAEMMVGRPVSFSYPGPRKMVANQKDLKPLLEIKSLTIPHPSEPLNSVSFQLSPHEIVGVAGIQGNGQTELLKFLSNPAQFPKASGEYRIRGQLAQGLTPRQLRRERVGLVPEDRISEGLLPEQSMEDNFLLGQDSDPRYQAAGLIHRAALGTSLAQKISEFDIRPADPSMVVARMSGGNQQKLVIARAVDPRPEILFIAHPTRGVDVGAIEKIHETIVQERNDGRGILLFSSELEELIDLSDRILVFFEGRIHAEFSRREFDPWAIGLAMGGGQK